MPYKQKCLKYSFYLTCAGTLPMFLMTSGRVCLLSTRSRLNCRIGCPWFPLWTGFNIVIQGRLPSPNTSNTSNLLLPKEKTLIKIKTKNLFLVFLEFLRGGNVKSFRGQKSFNTLVTNWNRNMPVFTKKLVYS